MTGSCRDLLCNVHVDDVGFSRVAIRVEEGFYKGSSKGSRRVLQGLL